MKADDIYAQFGREFIKARKNLGLTQTDIAKKLGVSHVAIGRYERGTIPRADKRGALIEIFGEDSGVIQAFDRCPKDKRVKRIYKDCVEYSTLLDHFEERTGIDISELKRGFYKILSSVEKEN